MPAASGQELASSASVAERSLSPRLDGSVALPDGRRIGFAEFGASNGPVVLAFHAGMSSRLDACWADDAARSRGVRVIGQGSPRHRTLEPEAIPSAVGLGRRRLGGG
jgi:hypothetical protein